MSDIEIKTKGIIDGTPKIPGVQTYNVSENVPIPFDSAIFNPNVLTNLQQNTPFVVTGVVPSNDAASATRYGTFFVADKSYKVVSVSEVHAACAVSGPTTVSVEKCPSGIAADSGTDILSTNFNLATGTNVVTYGVLKSSGTAVTLVKGDRLVLKDTGNLTSVSFVAVSCVLQNI